MNRKIIAVISGIFMTVLACSTRMAGDTVRMRYRPPARGFHPTYVFSRPPLASNPLVKLPIGAIAPKGWLLKQLELERDGLVGHLAEISRFLGEGSGWKTFSKGSWGWEEVPYWLKGYGDLGYLLRDPQITGETKKWLYDAMKSQDSEGYFGPPDNKEKGDLWPNMVMVFALQSLYEATQDTLVLPFLTRYFLYQSRLPVDELLPSSWQKFRGGENLESIYWLYNRTGDRFLLDLAKVVYARTCDWASPILTEDRDIRWEPSGFYHGVNISMGLRYPALYYQQSKKQLHLDAAERNYRLIRDRYGQSPGGMFAADENIRPGYAGPEQGAETCSMAELMHSHECILKITGNTVSADRCEEIAFNSLPAALTPDFKGLHYLTAPNLISCDSTGAHDFENSGDLLSYSPWKYRCCQHNVAFGWPYFAEHLWMATLDKGAAAILYAPCETEIQVGDGSLIRILEETGYPFDSSVVLTLAMEHPVEFPLYIRIPGWCSSPRITVNGVPLRGTLGSGGYAYLRKKWKSGDRVAIEFPMEIEVTRWEKNRNAVSVRRGPLWYSLKIAEMWKRIGGTDRWPAYEVLPGSPWNYGLVPDSESSGFRFEIRKMPLTDQPFDSENAPVLLTAQGKILPQWRKRGNMVGHVPESPAESDMPTVPVTLLPMGCARLRISVIPVAQ